MGFGIARFAEEAPPEMRGRIDDVKECREFWLNPFPRPRKKAPAKPTPVMFPVTAWGETKGILAWSRDQRCRVWAATLKTRLLRKERVWSPEEAISTPPKQGLKIVELIHEKATKVEIFGETKTIDEVVARSTLSGQSDLVSGTLETGRVSGVGASRRLPA